MPNGQTTENRNNKAISKATLLPFTNIYKINEIRRHLYFGGENHIEICEEMSADWLKGGILSQLGYGLCGKYDPHRTVCTHDEIDYVNI